MKKSGIFQDNIFGERIEIEQSSIDFWCEQCQFSYDSERCKEKSLIQECWDESESIGGKWHLQHECPFVHKGEVCRCNDFKNIKEAFKAAGLEYKKR